jgi:aryl-alcohol dehydrogenase-like predicted oxidoreductase
MKTLPFGNTELKVTKLGLGMAALGRPGYINLGHGHDLKANYKVEVMQENALTVLEAAYAHGIRYFDVARSYGKGEEFLGQWIKEHPSYKDIVIGSKWGYTYTAGWKVKAEQHEVKEHSLELLRRQWPLSRQLLGEHLAIYHIHSATPESGVLDNTEVLDRLWALKNSGIVVGLSLSGPNQQEILEKALHIKNGNDLLFQSVQASWNILEPSAGAVLQKASQRGLGIIIKEALANGRLTARNTDPHFVNKKELLQTMAEKHTVGIDALSIAYVLQQSWANTILSGASTEAQLLSNLQALKVQLDEEDVVLLKHMAEPAQEYWNKRATMAWN